MKFNSATVLLTGCLASLAHAQAADPSYISVQFLDSDGHDIDDGTANFNIGCAGTTGLVHLGTPKKFRSTEASVRGWQGDCWLTVFCDDDNGVTPYEANIEKIKTDIAGDAYVINGLCGDYENYDFFLSAYVAGCPCSDGTGGGPG